MNAPAAKRPPLQDAEEIFYLVEQQASALSALGELMVASPPEKITDCTIEGIGRMLEIVSKVMFDTAMAGVQVCQPPPPAAEPT